METKLERDVRLLKTYAVVITLVCGVFTVSAFTLQNRKQKFEEIDVERINVVEKDGSLRLVMSNSKLMPGPMQRGKPFGYPGGNRGAGLLFYNDAGTESGGLIFSGKTDKNGKPIAVGSLTLDQYEQDQTVALQYYEEDGSRRAGLAINDLPTTISSLELDEKRKAIAKMPDGPAKTEEKKKLRQYRFINRFYAGRGRDGNSVIELSDPEGRPRLLLAVEPDGSASIEFMDEKGNVTNRIPAQKNKEP